MTERRRVDFKKWRKWQIIRRMALFVLAICLVLFGIGKWNEYKRERAAQEEAARIAAEKERAEREHQEAIEAALNADKYKEELTDLYIKYPQLEKLILNRSEYPDKVVKYLINKEEVIDWVLDYPEYMAMSSEELDLLAKAPIEEYEVIQNGIPLLQQWDQRWGYTSYGDGLIARNGCGPTVVSMAVIGLTGDNTVTPKVVADMAVEKGYFVEDVGSSWALMTEGVEKYGLKSEQIMDWATWAITDELEKGNVVICNVGPGDFTSRGHFILLVGINDDGTIMVNDPNSKANSEKSWDVQCILDQAKGLWAVKK